MLGMRWRGDVRRTGLFICILIAAIGAITAALIAGVLQDRGADSNVTPQRTVDVSVRLNGSAGPKFAAEIYSQRAGIFKKNSLDVKLTFDNEGDDAIAAVVRGAALAGVTDSISFLNARAKGQPIVAFAAGFLESETVFYALEKSGIRMLQDFIGKRVGRIAGSDSAIFYDALLSRGGISRSQIRESAIDTDLDALLNDRVDVIPGRIGHEGFLLRQKGVAFTVIRILDYGIHVPGMVYFTTEKLIRDRPSMMQRFLQGIIAGWAIIYADPAKSIPLIVAARKDLTPEQVQFELAVQRDFVMPLGRRVAEFDDQQWKQLRSILTNARLMDGSVDLSRAVNYDILREAYRRPISFGN